MLLLPAQACHQLQQAGDLSLGTTTPTALQPLVVTSAEGMVL